MGEIPNYMSMLTTPTGFLPGHSRWCFLSRFCQKCFSLMKVSAKNGQARFQFFNLAENYEKQSKDINGRMLLAASTCPCFLWRTRQQVKTETFFIILPVIICIYLCDIISFNSRSFEHSIHISFSSFELKKYTQIDTGRYFHLVRL